MHDALFVPIILGSNKMMVSVATGHNEYWPLYASIGSIHNNVRHVHGDGLVLISFLSYIYTQRYHTFSIFVTTISGL